MLYLVFDKCSQLNQSRKLKWFVAVVFTAVFALGCPRYLDEAIDRLWIEEAHQAMLTGLVESRNFALEHGVDVYLCAAAVQDKCVVDRESEFNGWLTYYKDNKGNHQPLNYHPFEPSLVGLVPSERYSARRALGFDREGFSLQKEVVSFDIYSLSGRTDKSYTIVIEPSGALQTLVNRRQQMPPLHRFAGAEISNNANKIKSDG